MFRTYLPKIYRKIFWSLFVILFLIGLYLPLFLLSLFYIGVSYLYRKRLILSSDKPSVNKKIVYSPISGEVKKITKNIDHVDFGSELIELQLCLPWWEEMGIYLPIAGHITNVTIGKPFNFFRLNRWPDLNQKEEFKGSMAVSIESEDAESFGLQLIKCPMGIGARTWIMPGDKVSIASNIGYIPLGGTVLLYLPKIYEILINEGDTLIAGETLIAGRS